MILLWAWIPVCSMHLFVLGQVLSGARSFHDEEQNHKRSSQTIQEYCSVSTPLPAACLPTSHYAWPTSVGQRIPQRRGGERIPAEKQENLP